MLNNMIISAKLKLDILQEELEKCQKQAGYMASADVVRSYLEKRVDQLEREVRLAEINRDKPDDIGAHDG